MSLLNANLSFVIVMFSEISYQQLSLKSLNNFTNEFILTCFQFQLCLEFQQL